MSFPDETDSTAALRVAVERLLARVGHWTHGRWAQPCVRSTRGGPSWAPRGGDPASLDPAGSAGAPSRADLVFGLVQELADISAEAEGRRHRPVPRLDNDLALPDQVRVMLADLIMADAPAASIRAAARVDRVATALSPPLFGRS